ncbi:unnamed protein product [Pylaiella littoralis]
MGVTFSRRLLGLASGVIWLGAADAAGNAEVFDLGSKLKAFDYSVMLTIVIVSLVVFDLILETFEHYLHHHKGRFHQNLFKKAIKELMILGLISFVLFILKDQAVFDQSDYVLTNTFNFVNLFLFFVGVSFVLAAVLIVMATSPLKARWDKYANVPLERLLDLHKEMTDNGWKWYAAWPPRYFTGLGQAQVIEYHLFRSVFLRLNRSLLTPAFDFSKYSGAIVDELVVEFFDVGWASWLLAVVALFFTVPVSTDSDGSEAVSAHGAILFGVALVLLELFLYVYCYYAHYEVTARMGVIGGFKGVGRVLEELWVEPKHHMDQETAAIDVKELLLAAPVNAPTLHQLTSGVSDSGLGASQAQVNFKARRSSSTSTNSTRRTSGSRSSSVDEGTAAMVTEAAAPSATATAPAPSATPDPVATATAAAATGCSSAEEGPKTSRQTSAAAAAAASPCSENGPDCPGCAACDPLWLAAGKVQACSMGGDPFVLASLSPPQRVVERFPGLLKGFDVKVGSYRLFKTLFGVSTLLKCYYSAFYFSYAIGRATESDTLDIVLWSALTPLPLLLCLLPLAKRTLPLMAQMACLQGQIVWELVSDIERQQEMAASAREAVLEKLRETIHLKMEGYKKAAHAVGGGVDGVRASPLSRAMEDLFGEWDTNGDGKITRQELARGLSNIGVYLSSLQLRELFRLADPDHSKYIDPGEFKAFLADLQSLENDQGSLSRRAVHGVAVVQVTLRLQLRATAEEEAHPLQDECGLLAAACGGAEAGAAGDCVARRARRRCRAGGGPNGNLGSSRNVVASHV